MGRRIRNRGRTHFSSTKPCRPRARGDDVNEGYGTAACAVPAAPTNHQTKKSRPEGRLFFQPGWILLGSRCSCRSSGRSSSRSSVCCVSSNRSCRSSYCCSGSSFSSWGLNYWCCWCWCSFNNWSWSNNRRFFFFASGQSQGQQGDDQQRFFHGFSLINSQKYKTLMR